MQRKGEQLAPADAVEHHAVAPARRAHVSFPDGMPGAQVGERGPSRGAELPETTGDAALAEQLIDICGELFRIAACSEFGQDRLQRGQPPATGHDIPYAREMVAESGELG
ncbi:hypothetical protein [Streptomyces sp. BE230]|uniref:hypothetical protein n=1 Tax=Streptomyces sp. BE230 TaxID=3002526 RepID=UPI002ED1A595|nr:hypothetical protein [Streptomyces sp. BE230]